MNIHPIAVAMSAMAFLSSFATAANPPYSDPAYGGLGDGIARVRINTGDGAGDAATAASAMIDGRIVLGGVTGTANQAGSRRLAFARLTQNGDSDPSFGPAGSGRIVLPLGDIDSLLGVEATAGGPLLFLAATAQNTVLVGKIDQQGGFVSSFGQNGVRSIAAARFIENGTIFRPLNLKVLSDGAILVVGIAMSNTSVCAAIARLTADGAFDAGFAGGGTLCLAPPRDLPPYALGADAVELADGHLLVSGSAYRTGGAGRDMFVARLAASGAIDAGFGVDGNGFAFVGFDQGGSLDDSARGIAVDSRGRIVIAGGVASDVSANDIDIGVARLFGDGRIDLSFGVEGKFVIGDWELDAGQQGATDVRILAGDRILVGGWSQGEERVSIALMLAEGGYRDEYFGEFGLFRQAASTAPEGTIVIPQVHNLLLAGDHLHFFGSIPVGPPLPDFSRNHAFAVARYVMPLFADGFDIVIKP